MTAGDKWMVALDAELVKAKVAQAGLDDVVAQSQANGKEHEQAFRI